MKKKFLGFLAVCCAFLGTSLTNAKNLSNSNASTVICTEDFEKQEPSTTYDTQKTYKKEDSNANLGWFVEHGTVSTTGCITGSQSMYMRAYYSKGSASQTWSGALPYCYTTSPINNVKFISFKAKAQKSTLKMNVEYSTNQTTWNALATDVSLRTDQTDYSYKLPKSYVNNLYLKISISSNSTHESLPAKSGNLYFVIDDITFKTPESSPTVSLSNATPVGGYYKDGSTKKQFVSFGATVSGDDLSVISKYGINVYNDSSCSTSSLVVSKSITIGEGGHTIKELTDKGGRFYAILSSDDGIEDKTKYYAEAFVEETSGASSESDAMSAEANTSGTEYEI